MASELYTFLEDEKKYICNTCGMKFTNRVSSVKRHCERRHNIDFIGGQIDMSSEEEYDQPKLKIFKYHTIPTHLASNFYKFLADEKKYVCNKCGQKFTNRVSSVKRHIKRRHNIELSRRKIENSSDTDQYDQRHKLKKLKSDVLQTHLNKNQFVKCCVGLVAVKNIPFRIFDDEEFFKVLIEPYEKQFGTKFNSRNIITTVESASSAISTILSKRFKNKLVSLIVDIDTRIDKSILGINIQYIRNFKVYVNTLGVIQLGKIHTAIHIKDDILKCLNEFGIVIPQIYSTTTDNAAMVLKASKILQELQEEGTDTSLDIASVMSVVKCAAHAIQLAANDVIKTLQLKIEDCRNVVRKMRATIRIADSGELMPTLDNEKRWNSTFNMLYSLQSIREFINDQDIEEEYIDIDWDFISNFITAFEPLAICTNKLQFEQCIVGDFYRDWRMCEIDVEFLILQTPYAQPLHNALQNRKQIMLKNEAFLAALYLDPRFNFEKSLLLTHNQKSSALLHLIKTYNLLKKMDADKKYLCDEQQSSSLMSEFSADPMDGAPCTSRSTLQRYEQRVSEECNDTSTIDENMQQSIKEKLWLLSKRKRVPCNTDVLEYWKTQSYDKDMKKLAQIVLAVPVTQISVEKSFSTLTQCTSKLQTKMTDKTINAVLLTKLNFDLLRPVDVKIDDNVNE